MSLIADSLKNALKTRAREKLPAPDINLMSRDVFKESPLRRYQKVIVLIVFPALILVFLIYAGAFDPNRSSITQLPLFGEKAPPQPVSPAPVPSQPSNKDELKIEAVPLPETAGQKASVAAKPGDDKQISEKMQTVIDAVTKLAASPPAAPSVPAKPDTIKNAMAELEAAVVRSAPPEKKSEKQGVAIAKLEPDVFLEAPELASRPREKKITPHPPLKEKSRRERELTSGGRQAAKPSVMPETSPGVREKEFVPANRPSPDILKDGNYYFNRGVFFQDTGDYEKALANFRTAAEADSTNPDIYNNMGVVYKEMKMYDQAVESFLRALYITPNYAKAYNNLGVVYYLKRNYEGAVANFQRAIEIQPRNLEAYNNLAVVFKDQDQWENALAVLNKAMSIDANHAPTNYNLAVLYEQKKDSANALHFYRRFVQLGLGTHAHLVAQVREHLKSLE